MAFPYIAVVYAKYLPEGQPHFGPGHLLLLAFWLANTLVLYGLSNRLLKPLQSSLAIRFSALIPALSYYLLFVIYASALIGYSNWGYISNYTLDLTFLPEMFHLADTLMVSRSLPVLALALPLLSLIFLFQWKAFLLDQGIAKFQTLNPSFKKIFTTLFLAGWLLTGLDYSTNLSYLIRLGHFQFDPVVRFFGPNNTFFPDSTERLLWERKDLLAEKNLRRRKPKVHTVLLFVVDALRADHLNPYGYGRTTSPFLLNLSHSSLCRKIDWAFANGAESSVGILSILTSKEPMDIGRSDYTLPDYFSDNGFKTALFLSGDHRWYDIDDCYGKKIALFVDGSMSPGPEGIDDDQMILEQLDRLRPDDGGYHFFYFHLMSTHQAGYLQERYLRYKPGINLAGHSFSVKDKNFPEESQELVNQYDDRILQADDLTRQILEKLKAKGYLRDYAAVFTGDHGQLFGEHSCFGHGQHVHLNILHIPFLFFGSKPFPAFPEKQFAVQLDIAPTLADAAGLQIPFSWQGQSLFRPRSKAWTYHFTPPLEPNNEGAVIRYKPGHILKYSRNLALKNGLPENEEVFDILRDPDEKQNQTGTIDPALLAQFRLQAWDHFISN